MALRLLMLDLEKVVATFVGVIIIIIIIIISIALCQDTYSRLQAPHSLLQ